MSYTGSPSTNPIDALRLKVGDYITPEWLTDDIYQYYLDKNLGNEDKAALEAARVILFRLSREVREKSYYLEIYSSDMFEQYRKALEMFVLNPSSDSVSLMLGALTPYAGGISKTDILNSIAAIDENSVDIQQSIPVDGEGRVVNNSNVFNTRKDYSSSDPFGL